MSDLYIGTDLVDIDRIQLSIDKKQNINNTKCKKLGYHHLVLLATNQEGYKNLLSLSSIGYLEGFNERFWPFFINFAVFYSSSRQINRFIFF